MTSWEKNCLLKSETLNLFQNNRVNSLSLLFCHSSSNSVSIPVYVVAWLHSFPIHLLISLLPVICFKLPITQTPDSSNFFQFPLKVWVIRSQLYLSLLHLNHIYLHIHLPLDHQHHHNHHQHLQTKKMNIRRKSLIIFLLHWTRDHHYFSSKSRLCNVKQLKSWSWTSYSNTNTCRHTKSSEIDHTIVIYISYSLPTAVWCLWHPKRIKTVKELWDWQGCS